MSKLLEEAKENRDKALSEAKRSHGDGERGLYSAWQEAVELIEKHEKPKGLLQCAPSNMQEDLGRAMQKVARQKQCKHCHEPHNYIFIYEENESNPDMKNGYINHEGILCIQFSSYVSVNLNINYCPMCGRDLKEVEE